MGNPCNECLVQACCSSICPSKENYTTFINRKYDNFRQVAGNPAYHKQLSEITNEKVMNLMDQTNINNRTKKKGR